MEYAFQCNKCGEHFHITESIEERERRQEQCPKCGSSEVERRMEPVYVATSKKS